MRQANKKSVAIVVDRRWPAVHRLATHDTAAECLGNRLVTQAYAQNWPLAGPFPDEIHRRAGIFRAAGTRRNHDRTERFGRSDLNTITSHYVNTRPELLQCLGQVPDERIFVVEQ